MGLPLQARIGGWPPCGQFALLLSACSRDDALFPMVLHSAGMRSAQAHSMSYYKARRRAAMACGDGCAWFRTSTAGTGLALLAPP